MMFTLYCNHSTMNGGQKLKSFNLHPISEAPLALPAPYSVVIRLSLQNASKGRFSFLPETMSRQYTKRGKHGGACIPFRIPPDSDRKSGDQLDPTHTAHSRARYGYQTPRRRISRCAAAQALSSHTGTNRHRAGHGRRRSQRENPAGWN